MRPPTKFLHGLLGVECCAGDCASGASRPGLSAPLMLLATEFPQAGVAVSGGRVQSTVTVIGEQAVTEPCTGPGPCSLVSTDLGVSVLEEREEHEGGRGAREEWSWWEGRVHVHEGLSLGPEWEALKAGRAGQ